MSQSKEIEKWREISNLTKKDIYSILRIPFKTTTNTKLRWFQFRINNRILCTNKFLYRIRKSDNQLCTFCSEEEETIEHLLWE